MKLSDLKTGMWVKLRNGDMCLFLKDYETMYYGTGAFVCIDGGFSSYSEYLDDMKHKNMEHNCLDIVEVFKPKGDQRVLNKDYLASIWKRVDIPESAIEVLKNINPKYEWIAKDSTGILFVYSKKPKKDKDGWSPQGFLDFEPMSYLFKQNLFDWINWDDDEPYYIPDLIGEDKD